MNDLTTSSLGPATLAVLPNGMRLIVLEDHRGGVATCNVWVRAGSNLEPDGVRGWSHGIEHMLFKGTDRRGERDFALAVADLGGRSNAGTGYETTNYHITVPTAGITAAADLLADILFHASFDPASLEAERQVLVHENHLHDDQPGGYGLTWRLALELACDASPYRRPIGGRDEDLLRTPRDEILAFWRAAYRPERMTTVVVGDVDTGRLLPELAVRLGSFTPPPAPPLPDPPVEPPHTAPRCRLVTADVKRLYAKLVVPAPPEGDPDRPVVEMIRHLLAEGRGSRLFREVRERAGLASEISLLGETGPREGWLVVDWETDPDRGRDALLAIVHELALLQQEPVDERERQRALARALLAHEANRETVQGQAFLIGWHDLMGDPLRAWDLPQRLDAVTTDDIMRVSRRLFAPEQISLLLYGPRDGLAPGLPRDGEALRPLLGELTGPGADTPGNPPRVRGTGFAPPAAATTDQPFVALELPGGARLYARYDPSLPLATVSVTVRGGVWLQDRPGEASLAQHVMLKGTEGRSAEELATAWEEKGVTVSPLVGRDQTGLVVAGLTRHWQEVLDLVATMVCRPTFPDDELERERRLALADLAAFADDPFQAAALRLRERFYGDHPYGPPLVGWPESLAALTPEDLHRWYNRVWRQGNIVIVASGDLAPESLARRLEPVLADMPAAPPVQVPGGGQIAVQGHVQETLRRDSQQVVVLAAVPGPAHPDAHRAELSLWQALLNGQSGRLFARLRNERSLCYTAGVQAAAGLGPGMIIAYILTSPDRVAEAADALRAELEETASSPPTAEELARARRRLRGNLLINRQTHGDRVSRCSTNVLYGRDPDDLRKLLAALDAVTPESLRAAVEYYLAAGTRLELRLGPA